MPEFSPFFSLPPDSTEMVSSAPAAKGKAKCFCPVNGRVVYEFDWLPKPLVVQLHEGVYFAPLVEINGQPVTLFKGQMFNYVALNIPVQLPDSDTVLNNCSATLRFLAQADEAIQQGLPSVDTIFGKMALTYTHVKKEKARPTIDLW